MERAPEVATWCSISRVSKAGGPTKTKGPSVPRQLPRDIVAVETPEPEVARMRGDLGVGIAQDHRGAAVVVAQGQRILGGDRERHDENGLAAADRLAMFDGNAQALVADGMRLAVVCVEWRSCYCSTTSIAGSVGGVVGSDRCVDPHAEPELQHQQPPQAGVMQAHAAAMFVQQHLHVLRLYQSSLARFGAEQDVVGRNP
jgi:hypothetical protein